MPSQAAGNDPNLSVGSFQVDDHGDNTWFELCLTATVEGTLTDVQCVELRPRKTTYTVLTDPPGLTINYEDEGTVLVGPAVIEPIRGSQQTLTAPATQRGHTFIRWDDGSTNRSRVFVTGDQPTTLTAFYDNREPVVEVEALSPLSGPAPLTVSLRATASDPEGDPVELTWTDGAGGTAVGADRVVHLLDSGHVRGLGGGRRRARRVEHGFRDRVGVGSGSGWWVVAGAVGVGCGGVGDRCRRRRRIPVGCSPPRWPVRISGISRIQFRFVSQPLTGDGQLVARVASFANTHAWAKAGVMVRESLAAGARHASVLVTPGNGVAFQRRAVANGESVHTAGSGSAVPRWVKLVRSGSTLTGFESAERVDLDPDRDADAVRAGGHGAGWLWRSPRTNTSTATTATFTDVAVSVSTPGPGNQPPVAAVSVSPLSGSAPLTVQASAAGSSDAGGWGVDVCVVDQ